MKARLWLSLLFCVSAVGWGQMSLTGSWSATVNLLPTIGLDTELSVTADIAGWKVGGTGAWFGADGYVWQTFDVGGAFGPMEVEWTLLFGPRAPAFLYTLGTAKITVAEIEFILYSAYVGPTIPGYVFTGGPSGGTVAVAKVDIGDTKLSFAVGFGARLRDFTIRYTGVGTHEKTYPVDPFPGGLQFTYLELDVEDIPFCCGITFDAEFSFTKAGFDKLVFRGLSVPLGLGVSFDFEITYGVTAKSVRITPRLAAIGDVCFAVWAGPVFTGGAVLPVWEGIRVDGFRIRCALGDCNYLEYVHAFNLAAPPAGTIPKAIRDKFVTPENQYLELGFCGPGCCGAQWEVTLRTMFATGTGTPPRGIFGITRFVGEVKIPIMTNFTVDLDFTMPAVPHVVPAFAPRFSFGWTFTF